MSEHTGTSERTGTGEHTGTSEHTGTDEHTGTSERKKHSWFPPTELTGVTSPRAVNLVLSKHFL
jgi:hypothetical protein